MNRIQRESSEKERELSERCLIYFPGDELKGNRDEEEVDLVQREKERGLELGTCFWVIVG